MNKIDIPLESFRNREGQQLLVVGQIVVVTTLDRNGNVNAALKSDFTRIVSEPPMIIFGCNANHHTAQNILESGEFVINIPGEDILPQVMKTSWDWPEGTDEIKAAGLTALASQAVAPPRISECSVHLECLEDGNRRFGDEIVFFGSVKAVSLNEDLLTCGIEEQYVQVRPVVFAGDDRYVPLSEAKKLPKLR